MRIASTSAARRSANSSRPVLRPSATAPGSSGPEQPEYHVGSERRERRRHGGDVPTGGIDFRAQRLEADTPVGEPVGVGPHMGDSLDATAHQGAHNFASGVAAGAGDECPGYDGFRLGMLKVFHDGPARCRASWTIWPMW